MKKKYNKFVIKGSLIKLPLKNFSILRFEADVDESCDEKLMYFFGPTLWFSARTLLRKFSDFPRMSYFQIVQIMSSNSIQSDAGDSTINFSLACWDPPPPPYSSVIHCRSKNFSLQTPVHSTSRGNLESDILRLTLRRVAIIANQ